MKYDVTIGIPVYKSRPYIERALKSALSQTYPSIEFLVIDDDGNDGSVEVIRQIASQHLKGNDVRIISHICNQGVSASRNEIIEKAQGNYLYFMDSDDEIREDTIELLMHQVVKYDAEIVFGSYEKIDISGDRTVYQYPSLQLFGKDKLACFAYQKYGGIQASVCNYLVKTSLLRKCSLRFIDTDFWEDFAFTFDLVTYISRAILLPNVTYSYFCREDSLSHYQERGQIPKDEIFQNIHTIDHLKKTSSILYNKVYFPNRCYNIVMTDFYIVSNVLKQRENIIPYISNNELKDMMQHPATWGQICGFKQSRLKNMLFYVIGKMPSLMCVFVIWILGKLKKLI